MHLSARPRISHPHIPVTNFVLYLLAFLLQHNSHSLTSFVSGPGHGAPGLITNSYLEGVYSEVYPNKGEDEEGMQKFFLQFSFPGGVGSHATPETPGSIHEGGELGYSISHAFGAVFDYPDLIALTMVGDGESETGPLATSWHSNKVINSYLERYKA